jgi:tellurite resistance protein TerC
MTATSTAGPQAPMALLETSNATDWAIFLGLVLGLLALDLGVVNRKANVSTVKSALRWSAFWIGIGLAFGAWVWLDRGREAGVAYLSCYVTEEALSVDNLFVFLAIFTYFKIEPQYQHRVLFWGILGAMVLRAAFILAGIGLISRFHWILYVFGAVLIWTGVKLLGHGASESDPSQSPIVRCCRRIFPISETLHGQSFFVVENGRRVATPLFLVLIALESSDVIFAVDSVPVALSFSTDAYIVYTSNIFAIMGLRSLYFALAALAQLFAYLKYGLAVVLIFVGLKMSKDALAWGLERAGLAGAGGALRELHIDPMVSLGIVVGLLALSVLASLARKR